MTVMKSIALNQKTKAAIDNIVAQSPQAVLLTGEVGAGKSTTALYIAELLIGETPKEGLSVHTIVPDKKGIVSIDQVRHIKEILKLKLPSKTARRGRIIIVEDAHAMREEAQNALLKTLEEPPEDTAIILISLSNKYLLPTVQSRAVHLNVGPLTLKEAQEHYPDIPAEELKRPFYMSNGNAGLLRALIEEKKDHPLLQSMQLAKQLLTSNSYERLKAIDTIIESAAQAQQVLYCLKRLLQYKIMQSARRADIDRLRLCIEAEKDVELHVHKKLIFTDLLLKI